jgi:hypothetical protein
MRRSVRVPEDRAAIQQELQWCLAEPINEAHLAEEIAALLASTGRTIDRRVLARRLAQAFASRFTHKSNQLQELIKYRPEELSVLKDAAVWDQIRTEVLPMIQQQKKRPAKLQTEEERRRRIKRAKNSYERFERSRIITPGYIEYEFADSGPRTGPCLDKIFHGGQAQMCGQGDSLQNLFGLSRKKLSMAAPHSARTEDLL